MRQGIFFLLMLVLSLGLLPVSAQDGEGGVLNIYSSRHYGALEAPFVAFTEATGIEVRVSQGTPRDLLARLQADIDRGGRSPADVFLAIDAGVLDIAAENGLLQPIESDVLDSNIAEAYREPSGYWYGLSIRARTAIINPANVTEEERASLTTYADLADPVWEDRLCMRPASHIYTVSWASSLIHHHGPEEAAEILAGIADNVTRYINSDTGQIRAVAAGECDVAVGNHYYMGRLSQGDEEDRATFEAVELVWLNQGEEDPGVFFNINGAGVVVNAANEANAIAFLEFMSTLDVQSGDDPEAFPASNYEYPTNPDAEPHSAIAQFGEVRFDTDYALWNYGELQSLAVETLEDVDFGFSEN